MNSFETKIKVLRMLGWRFGNVDDDTIVEVGERIPGGGIVVKVVGARKDAFFLPFEFPEEKAKKAENEILILMGTGWERKYCNSGDIYTEIAPYVLFQNYKCFREYGEPQQRSWGVEVPFQEYVFLKRETFEAVLLELPFLQPKADDFFSSFLFQKIKDLISSPISSPNDKNFRKVVVLMNMLSKQENWTNRQTPIEKKIENFIKK